MLILISQSIRVNYNYELVTYKNGKISMKEEQKGQNFTIGSQKRCKVSFVALFNIPTLLISPQLISRAHRGRVNRSEREKNLIQFPRDSLQSNWTSF